MDLAPWQPNRITRVNQAPVQETGQYLLYWMTAFRRPFWNFALERAAKLAAGQRKPLLILEALSSGYPWASARFQTFVIQGMMDNHSVLAGRPGLLYYPYVEPRAGAGSGLVRALARNAVMVVADDWPGFFLPRVMRAAARQIPVRLEKVDSCGLLPVKTPGRFFTTAHSFRRFLQKELPRHLEHLPSPDPLQGMDLPPLAPLDRDITHRWPPLTLNRPYSAPLPWVQDLPIDQQIKPGPLKGGWRAGQELLTEFLDRRLPRYADDRNHPDHDATSRLSGHLHFGHISAHQVFFELMAREGWFPEKLSLTARGNREGWWGVGRSAEAFLDQLITWRELGFNACEYRPDVEDFASLPDWAQTTLAEHANDLRPYLYSLEEFETARTHDPLWNAAQTQLVQTGAMHNYLRMLWGKKILEWSPTPQDALKTMIVLNNKYALDGRDPNSLSGIFWILGRYDRAWPSRPVFGKIRYMSSENTRRKLRLRQYLAQWSDEPRS